MSEISWIHLSTDMFNDEKIKHIRRMPDGNNIILVWIGLLCLTGKLNSCGYIFITEDIPFTAEDISGQFDIELNTAKLALMTFEKLGMINIEEDGKIYISNWGKYQNLDALEKIRVDTRKRVRRYREKHQKLLPLLDDVTLHETLRNVTVTTKEEEEEEEEEEDLYNNTNVSGVNNNKDSGIKRSSSHITFEEYYESLKSKYSTLDYDAEYEKFNLYWHEGKRKLKNAKLAWRNWLDHALKWQLEHKEQDNGKTRENTRRIEIRNRVPPEGKYTTIEEIRAEQ